MMRLSDALTLAITKLRTRRIRLIVTIIVSGLFFVVLAFASFIFEGSLSSIERFSEDGFGKRFITKVDSIGFGDEYTLYSDAGFIAEAKAVDKAYFEQRKAAAKKLGISYDSAQDQPSVMQSGPNGEEMVSPTPQLEPLLQQKRLELSKPYYEALDRIQTQYDIIDRYDGVMLTGGYSPTPGSSGPTMIIIKDGKEDSGAKDLFEVRGISSLTTGLTALTDPVLQTFLLPGQDMSVKDGAVPVIAPYSAAEETLGLATLPASASSEARLERLKEVRERVSGATFQVCVRNQTSIERQEQAKQQQLEIEQNKDKRGYVRPELLYDVAAEPCKDVVVTRDVRSAATKKDAANQEAFAQQFGKQPAAQRLVTFRIVGITADPPTFGGFSVKTLITALLASNLGQGWFMPLSAQTALPEYDSLFQNVGKIYSYSNSVYVELANADETKQFVAEQSCDIGSFFGDIASYCNERNTPFTLSSFGSNSVALTDVKNGFQTFFSRASIVVAIISAIIMMGTIGKVIADSRRETAVFRAIGAKRLHIAQIYVLYAAMLGIIVAVFSLGAGFLLASFVDNRYSSELSVDAIIAYGSSDLTRTFSVAGVNERQVLTLLAIIIGAALVSAILPLLSNIKRNPIKDMRDER